MTPSPGELSDTVGPVPPTRPLDAAAVDVESHLAAAAAHQRRAARLMSEGDHALAGEAMRSAGQALLAAGDAALARAGAARRR